jgi:ankyrin repeat protein
MTIKHIITIICAIFSFATYAKEPSEFAPKTCNPTKVTLKGKAFDNRVTHDKLFNAISSNSDAITLRLLIDKNYINTPNALGITPLMLAAEKGNWPAAIELISSGANINLKTDTGSPLLSAIAGSQFETAFKLIEKGALLPTDCEDQYTLMRTAFIVERQKYTDSSIFIAYLLSNGFDPNNMDDPSYTPLMAAVALGSDSMVRVLLAHGAIVNKKSSTGKNVWDIVKKMNNEKMKKLLSRRR